MTQESAFERASRTGGVEKRPPRPPKIGLRVSETGEPIPPQDVEREEADEQRAREAMTKPRAPSEEQ
jgi:hypothetical protein